MEQLSSMRKLGHGFLSFAMDRCAGKERPLPDV